MAGEQKDGMIVDHTDADWVLVQYRQTGFRAYPKKPYKWHPDAAYTNASECVGHVFRIGP